jgi:hypothetical protein
MLPISCNGDLRRGSYCGIVSSVADRRRRESQWKDLEAYEADIMQPYLDAYNVEAKDWLNQIGDRFTVIMDTNTHLQNQLIEESAALTKLQKQYDVISQDWDQMQFRLRENKERQAIAEEQLKQLRTARFAEERSLRNQTTSLHNKVKVLVEKQRSLESQKRDDEGRLKKQKDLLEDLRLVEANLNIRLQSTDLEVENGEDAQAGKSGTENDVVGSLREDTEHEKGRGSWGSDSFMTASRSGTPFSMAPSLPIHTASRPVTLTDTQDVPMIFDDLHRASPLLPRSPTPDQTPLSPSRMRTSPPPRGTPGSRSNTPLIGSHGDDSCVSCGAVLMADATFCRKCGKKREILVCACGNTLMSDSLFCRRCGRKCRDEDPLSPSSRPSHPYSPSRTETK